MIGNVAKDLSATTVGTLRSAATKSSNGNFAGDIRRVGALVQYQRSPGVWVNAEVATVPSVQLGGTYQLPPSENIFGISCSYDGHIVAVPSDQVGSGSALTMMTNTNGVYSLTPIAAPTGQIGFIINGVTALTNDGLVCAFGFAGDSGDIGAVWIYAKVAGSLTWTQQGTKIVGEDIVGQAEFGGAVSLSGDGALLAVAGSSDDSRGAVWIYSKTSLSEWDFVTKLIGEPLAPGAVFGEDVCLSADGSTLAVGALQDPGSDGSVFIFTRVAGLWTQQAKLVKPTGVFGGAMGRYLSLSADGNTLSASCTYNMLIFYRYINISGPTWSAGQVLPLPFDLVNYVPPYGHGMLSQDGNTLYVSNARNMVNVGASWIYTQAPPGIWTQNGPGFVGNTVPLAQGYGVLSGDGKVAVVPDSDGQSKLFIFV